MRSLFWCSAALLIAGCGGGAKPIDPFAYHDAPIDIRNRTVYGTSPFATIYALDFAGIGNTRVPAYLIVPRAPGRHPGVLLLHGSGGTRSDLLGHAGVLSKRGIVALTISYPSDAPTYKPLVVDARRALDLLAGWPDVDAKRIGVVGFSLGAQLAAILAGDDARPKAVDVIGGRGNEETLYWIRKARAHLFFQAGERDEVVPHAQLLALMRAAPGRPRIRWYPVGHLLSKAIDDDMVAWESKELGVD
jgi:dienelactone hydrolase